MMPPRPSSTRASSRRSCARSSRTFAAGCTRARSRVALAAGIVLVVLADGTRETVATAIYARDRRPAVRRQRALPPRQLVTADREAAQAARPLEHLPDHRRHLHAVQRHPAARRRRHARCSGSSGPAALAASPSGCCGSAPRAGSTRRSTSRWAGSPSSTSPTSSTPAAPRSSRCSPSAAALQRRRASSTRIKRPNPSPRWFGFHEVFHALTLGGVRACTTSRSRSRPTPPSVARAGVVRPASPELGCRSGPCARTRSTCSIAARSSPSHASALLADQPHRPGQRLGAGPGHARRDQGVEHQPLGLAQPGHHRHREVGEQQPPAVAPRRPTRPCGRSGARPRGRSRSAARGCPRGSCRARPSAAAARSASEAPSADLGGGQGADDGDLLAVDPDVDRRR